MTESPSQDRGSESHLMQHALRAAGVGCWDLDLATGSLWRSPEYDRIWGTTRTDATMPLNALFAGIIPEDREAVTQAFELASSQGVIAVEKRIQRVDDNSIRWIRLTGQGYYHAEKLAGIAGVVADVTPEHLACEKLRHTEKMESLGYMAREVAHDFNNLLMVIGASLEMLSEQIEGDRASRLVSAMNNGVERGVALTQNLMDFSRPAGAEIKVVNIDRLIASAWLDLIRIAGDTVVVTITPGPLAWCYCADPAQLTKAMTNLAENAREAMPDGGHLVVSTTVRNVDGASAVSFGVRTGDYVGISFSDNGIGIARDLIARVFEPLFSTKQDKKGRGFGLSQVYAAASSSGGFVTIESQPEHGATVVIYLPFASSPASH